MHTLEITSTGKRWWRPCGAVIELIYGYPHDGVWPLFTHRYGQWTDNRIDWLGSAIEYFRADYSHIPFTLSNKLPTA